jgi:hypothetical protein
MITGRLFTAEQDLLIASLAFTGSIHQVFEVELVNIPSVREDSIWRNIAAENRPDQSARFIEV